MRHWIKPIVPAALAFCIPLTAHAAKEIVPASAEARLDLIAQARVWTPVNVASQNLLQGPQEGHSYRFGDTVKCTFQEPDPRNPPGGATSKFYCVDASGDELKIKYGAENGEVPSEIAASRLMWALGFPADRNYPVRVECTNCPRDPWRYIEDKLSGRYDETVLRNNDVWALQAYERGNHIFIPALVEKKFKGRTIELHKDQGWTFKELLDFSRVPHEEQIHREAYALLLAMIQHADSKADNQRLACPEGQDFVMSSGQESCRSPVMFAHDLGWAFGHGWNPGRELNASKMVLQDWMATPIWKNREQCLAGVNTFFAGGTFRDVRIREESRAFLSSLLNALSRKQIEDIFRAARVDLQFPIAPSQAVAEQRVQDWANAFETKRNELAQSRCPN